MYISPLYCQHTVSLNRFFTSFMADNPFFRSAPKSCRAHFIHLLKSNAPVIYYTFALPTFQFSSFYFILFSVIFQDRNFFPPFFSTQIFIRSSFGRTSYIYVDVQFLFFLLSLHKHRFFFLTYYGWI